MIFFPSFYHIKKIKDHSIEKERLLSVCSTFDYAYRNTDEEKRLDYYSYISNTNWQFKESMYEGTFSKRDRKELEEYICKKYKVNDILIKRQWFNQYYATSGSDHPFHNHSDDYPNDLACIYYLELKDKSLRTILKHPRTGKEVVPRVKEGQILIFDAKIWHKSPRNYTNTRKTVISFNIDFLR